MEKLEQNQAQIEVSGEVETADVQAEVPTGSVVTVGDTTLKEGRNAIKIKVEDPQGNQAFYQIAVYPSGNKGNSKAGRNKACPSSETGRKG